MTGPDTTESLVTGALGADCYSCGATAGCFDPAQSGVTCEGAAGNATLLATLPGGASCTSVFGVPSGVVTEANVCLVTLKTILTSGCAQNGVLDPCLCGSVDEMDCTSDAVAPNGPAAPDYFCDFNTTASSAVESDLAANSSLGAGGAYAIVQCLAAVDCPSCPLHGTP